MIEDPTKSTPTKKYEKSIDPSEIPGYFGTFRCKPSQGEEFCNVVTMGMSDQGDFTFDYGTNPDILDMANME